MNMKVNLCTIVLVVLINSKVCAQTPLPYFTGFDDASQQAGWQQFRKGTVSNAGWGYTTFYSFSVPANLSHYYPVGGSSATDDWFVSPSFDFSSGGKIDSLRHRFSGFGNPGAGDSIAIYLLAGSPDPALATSKILLRDFTLNYVADNMWHLDTGIVIPPSPGQSYIGFKYRTVVNWLDVLIDNFRVSSNASTEIASQEQPEKFYIYPNPAVDFAELQFPVNTTSVEIINCVGQTILARQTENAGAMRIDLEKMKGGIYFIKFVSKGSVTLQRLIVER
jgi:hypothetical protein